MTPPGRFSVRRKPRSWAVLAALALVGTNVGATGAGQVGTNTITTFAGGGTVSGGDGRPATSAKLFVPEAVAVDGKGNVYIADSATQRVRMVSPAGVITTFAGGGSSTGDGVPATSAQLKTPSGVAVDAKGAVYISDFLDHRVRRVTANGRITTVAGTGVAGFSGDGGRATAARLNDPRGVAVDAKGNVYIADLLNGRVRKVSAGGTITTFAGGGASLGDGVPATSAKLASPHGVAVDAKGNVYIAGGSVRVVNPAGTITTFAGGGVVLGDGGPATSARVDDPYGVAVDGKGNVYIGEAGGHRVRLVSTDGTITTFAGTGKPGFSGDGGPATSARLYGPEGIAVTEEGAVYIADTFNRRVRRVGAGAPVLGPVTGTPSGVVLVNGKPYAGGPIPYGSKVDVTKGTVTLKASVGALTASGGGGITAKFVLLREREAGTPVVELRLTGGDFNVCKTTRRAFAAPAVDAKKPPKTVRRLFGKGKGKFRTRGQYASSAIRGTAWLIADRCDGTYVKTRQGVVSVFDRVLQKTVLVKAGQSYLARKP